MGDVASQGTGGGIVSNNVQGATSFVGPGSLDVTIEGKAVQLLGDQMLNNCGPSGSPANAATMPGEMQAPGVPVKPPYPEDGGIDCEKQKKPQSEGGLGWDDCDVKQLCAKVKALNGSKLEKTPGANKLPAYNNTKNDFKKIFKKAAAEPDSPAVKAQFFDPCAHEKWKAGDPPFKKPMDPEPSVKLDKPTQEACNPDHVHDAALGGDLEDLGNLKWLSATVNKSIGSTMKNYDPEKHGKIVVNPNCGCDA